MFSLPTLSLSSLCCYIQCMFFLLLRLWSHVSMPPFVGRSGDGPLACLSLVRAYSRVPSATLAPALHSARVSYSAFGLGHQPQPPLHPRPTSLLLSPSPSLPCRVFPASRRSPLPPAPPPSIPAPPAPSTQPALRLHGGLLRSTDLLVDFRHHSHQREGLQLE